MIYTCTRRVGIYGLRRACVLACIYIYYDIYTKRRGQRIKNYIVREYNVRYTSCVYIVQSPVGYRNRN